MLRTKTVLAACLWLVACSAAIDPPDAGTDTPGDSGTITDAGPSLPLAVCERCAEDLDCAEDHRCVGLATGGRVCLPSCGVSACPDRFECVDQVCTPMNGRCCLDPDGDTFGVGSGCRGDDCDEADPAVNFGAAEVCDQLDNDCDGTIDEDDPGSGQACSTALSGACASGVTACMNGALQCRPVQSTMPELCDGLDNDCDSFVDEDSTGLALTRTCYTGPVGTLGIGPCVAGTETCSGGQFRTCLGEITPSADVCDGLDNDCDGAADEGDPGGGGSCVTGAPGLCSTGTLHCDGGVLSCVPSTTPGAEQERCDQLDNDCDGEVDEGFPGLGQPCTAGVGTCARGGVVICDATDSTRTTCSATAGTANAAEACDYLDDDCDGEVDEGFRNDAGVYAGLANCGACGRDCDDDWPGGAAANHVVPTCAVSGVTASCGYLCAPGYRDLDGVRDNGCEFREEPDTVFVSSARGVDSSSCGTFLLPCASLQFGVARASATGRTRVRASTGLYRENLTLMNGISVLGGHSDVNWARDPAIFRTTLRGVDAPTAGAGTNDRIVVSALNINLATELSGFAIEAIDARAGGNSIAVYVRDSNQTLSINDNEISSGSGGNGATGAAGNPGAPGPNGAAGAGSLRQACVLPTRPGPVAGFNVCSGTSANGGAGGASTNPTTSASAPTRQTTGMPGVGLRGGAGGLGGFNLEGASGPICNLFDTPVDGESGADGQPGQEGSPGGGAVDSDGTLVSGHWRGSSGSPGTNGSPGGGGGGGAAGGGVEEPSGGQCIFPPTGGSGGAGGCPGSGGSGGSAGGGSFGLMIVHTTSVGASAMPRVINNRLRRGEGGRGGEGGAGGAGGAGGSGGPGGPRPASPVNVYDFCIRPGARGGDGARGGHAGGGGGGAGGVSFDIWVSRPGTALPALGQNTFELPTETNTGGPGGAGGGSLSTAVGGAGSAGAFGNVRLGT